MRHSRFDRAGIASFSSAWRRAAWAAACRSMFCRYRPTKSTGSSISGGKPPSRTAVAMISRANGNNSRGHSIMTSGCRFSLRHVHDAEHAGIGELEAEHHLAAVFGLALDRQRHLVLVLGDVVGADIDLDVDRRLLLLRRQRGGRVRILERQVLGVLRQHVELGRGLPRGAPLPLVMKLSPEVASGDRFRLNSLEVAEMPCRGEWLS